MELLLSGVVGLAAGILSGLFGIGGGVIVVPSLIFLVGLTLREATGTSLAALLLPVGILGVLAYAKEGFVSFPLAALLAAGLVVGTFLGARLALSLPEVWLRRGLAGLLILVALQLLLRR